MIRIAALAGALLLATHVNAQTPMVMPLPSSWKATEERYRIDAGFSIAVTGAPGERLYKEAGRFFKRLAERTGIFVKTWNVSPKDARSDAALKIHAEGTGKVALGMDESYRLRVDAKGVHLQAATDIGAVRGLETLLQLVDSDANGYYFTGCEVEDKPRFAWRGLLVSQPYHFMPMDVILRTLDAMAAVKMNVLHFYLSDDQGYSIESKAYPKLHREASGGEYFTHEQVREIVRHADQRGIRVVPEVDLPGHCTAILSAYPELAAVKRRYELQDHWGVFDPSMDPTREAVYRFLDTLLTEVAALFPDEYFHIGGDENTGVDWRQNDSIQRFMKAHGLNSTVALQNHFNRRVQRILSRSGKKVVGWDEVLMREIDDSTARELFKKGDYAPLVEQAVPRDIVIQSWRGMEALISSAKNGYRSILSKGYYIDLMQSTAYHYLNDPVPWRNEDIVPDSEANFNRFESAITERIRSGDRILTPEEEKRIIGGEATMWTEHVTPETFDSRVWPRTAAIAERLWSPAEVRDVADMYRRLDAVSLHLEALGSTHVKNAGMMLRRLAGTDETAALQRVVGYLEPLKGYRRNAADNFTKYAPYTQLVDIAVADPKALRTLRGMVDTYLRYRATEAENAIRFELAAWVTDHDRIARLAWKRPALQTLAQHSASLKELAELTLRRLGLKEGHEGLDALKSAYMTALKKAAQPAGYCELQVASALEPLWK